MSDQRHQRPPPDHDAIRAELEALGEDPGSDLTGELGDASQLVAALDAPAGDDVTDGLSFLRLGAPAAQLSEDRSQDLLRGLQLMVGQRAAVADELRASGEAVGAGLGDELGDALLLGDVLDAFRAGPEAVDALPDPASEQMERLDGALIGMNTLRLTGAEGSLSSARSDALWEATEARLPAREPQGAQVIDLGQWRRRALVGSVFAAAAMVLLVCASGIVFQHFMAQDQTTDLGVVAQVELLQAEENLARVESDALKTLMSSNAAPTGPKGDHYLRTLRQARHEAVRARTQAQERRL